MSDETKSVTATGGDTFTELFQIRPDISFDHAFQELSVLLGCIRHLTDEAEMEKDRHSGTAARILSAFAKALINAMERGKAKPY
jgi:hypothetical protein